MLLKPGEVMQTDTLETTVPNVQAQTGEWFPFTPAVAREFEKPEAWRDKTFFASEKYDFLNHHDQHLERMQLGRFIEQYRRAANLTRESAAELFEVDLDRYIRIELGFVFPDPEVFERILFRMPWWATILGHSALIHLCKSLFTEWGQNVVEEQRRVQSFLLFAYFDMNPPTEGDEQLLAKQYDVLASMIQYRVQTLTYFALRNDAITASRLLRVEEDDNGKAETEAYEQALKVVDLYEATHKQEEALPDAPVSIDDMKMRLIDAAEDPMVKAALDAAARQLAVVEHNIDYLRRENDELYQEIRELTDDLVAMKGRN